MKNFIYSITVGKKQKTFNRKTEKRQMIVDQHESGTVYIKYIINEKYNLTELGP